jgi:L-ascorbate metabolism protein UlaG (beta-lactamase superfamily)
MKTKFLVTAIIVFITLTSMAQELQKDVIETLGGDLTITFIGHGTLMFEYQDKVIHIDPWSRLTDYSKLPKADAILITHDHGDHLDPEAIKMIEKENTEIYLTKICYDLIKKGKILNNGDYIATAGIPVEATAAYNRLARRGNGKPYHAKGDGNGYIISFSNVRVYVAGDTEWIPEMQSLLNITIAFLPMNLPYTMEPQMVAHIAKQIKPKILYPYHFGDTLTDDLVQLLLGSDIEVRIRSMK